MSEARNVGVGTRVTLPLVLLLTLISAGWIAKSYVDSIVNQINSHTDLIVTELSKRVDGDEKDISDVKRTQKYAINYWDWQSYSTQLYRLNTNLLRKDDTRTGLDVPDVVVPK